MVDLVAMVEVTLVDEVDEEMTGHLLLMALMYQTWADSKLCGQRWRKLAYNGRSCAVMLCAEIVQSSYAVCCAECIE